MRHNQSLLIEFGERADARPPNRESSDVCAWHGALLEGESPLHTRQGEVLAKGNGVVVRRGRKAAISKTLAR